ncbi:MAG: DHH family phosphoesterase [Patescibacteria group bacterium]
MPETKLPSTDLAPPDTELLRRIITETQRPLAIVTTQLDPDSMGASMLMRKLLRSLGQDAIVCYAGAGNSDPQNQTAFTMCNLAPIFRPKEELPRDAAVILLDSAILHDKRWGEEPLDPIIVIDHHDSRLSPSANRWVWIEPRFGAASTMVARLLQVFEVKLTDDDREVATIGAFGVYNDTRGLLSKTTSLDREMFTELMRHGDQRLLQDLHEFPLPEAYYAFMATAYRTKTIHQAKLIATVGEMTAHDNTLLARVATKLVRWEGVYTVIVWGLQDGKLVTVKARTIDRANDLNDLLHLHFPGYGGAKGHEGGADIPLGVLAPPNGASCAILLEFLQKLFNDKFGANGS